VSFNADKNTFLLSQSLYQYYTKQIIMCLTLYLTKYLLPCVMRFRTEVAGLNAILLL